METVPVERQLSSDQEDVTIPLKQFSAVANVGDSFSALLVTGLTGRQVHVVGEEPLDRPNLVGAGSLAQWADAQSFLWGCGLMEPRLLPAVPPRTVLGVRGPLTRAALQAHGIQCDGALCDPGWLLPAVIESAAPQHPVGVVPHYVDAATQFVDRRRREGVPIIDVHAPPMDFVRQLTSCERIVSSSLHGIVLAHAYDRPAVWVQISRRVLGGGFKFRDYYASIGVDNPRRMSPWRHSFQTMVDACAPPAVRPQVDALAAALVNIADELDD